MHSKCLLICLAVLGTRHMEVGRHRDMMANERNRGNLNEKVKTLKYLGSLLTNQDTINEKIKSRLKAENSCYYSVQTPFSSRLPSKNLKIKICKTIM